ncbi:MULTISPECIES: argonaute PAZ domain-containing protein [unclassified Pseudomonas]|uniref:argonaute PAZ domain-containing protein n=1 Tax=unclassified Pseudomonas TaxID=196821 RepID=UPI002580013A|nr:MULTISPECIES: argonaute PAZ domain-containing protein [unclassified Pseudomonas]
MSKLGIAALQLERNLGSLPVYVYDLTFVSSPSDQEPIQLTRRGASQLSWVNRQTAITDFGPFKLVTMRPLSAYEANWQGVHCVVQGERELTLSSENELHRETIKRLVNQCLMQGTRQLANVSNGAMQAEYGQGYQVELIDCLASSRVAVRNEFLDVFQCLRLVPEVLPDGSTLVSFMVRHRLLPREHITLDWVIKTRPEWLESIKRVRHRYSSQGKAPGSANFIAIEESRSAQSQISTAQGKISLFDYHDQRGNILPGEKGLAYVSSVVKVSYGRSKESFEHLATLLQPMFDFETLQGIDGKLLERIAKGLKWPIADRLEAAAQRIKNLKVGELACGLTTVRNLDERVQYLRPPIRLRFANDKIGDHEKLVTKHGAFRGMQRELVVPIVIGGTNEEQQAAKQHFYNVEKICQLWSSESPRWKQVPSANDELELDARLSSKTLPEALLFIALGRNANKQAIRNVAYRYGLATQFMRLDHPARIYQQTYYNNLAAGLFSKAGGLICGLDEMPGDTDLFIGLDLGGVGQRLPGTAFLFTRSGAQLGWQLAEAQKGERVENEVLHDLLERSLQAFVRANDGLLPQRITLHRDGHLYESLDVIKRVEQKHNVGIDVLEVIKSGCPPLFRRSQGPEGKAIYSNPEVGDAFELSGLDELIVATYSSQDLGQAWGDKVTVRPLRLRKRYGLTDLHTLAKQVILLSRIHGASLYRHPRLPVTTHHADRFASLRQECHLDDLSRMDRLCPVYL